MKKFLRFVKDNIFNFLFWILGIWLGFYAARINRAGVGGYIILIIVGIIFTLSMRNAYFQTTPSKVIGLFIGFALSYPIAYAIQYVITFVKFVLGKAIWFFKIPIIGPITAVVLIVIVGYTIYFVIDSIITAKGIKK